MNTIPGRLKAVHEAHGQYFQLPGCISSETLSVVPLEEGNASMNVNSQRVFFAGMISNGMVCRKYVFS